MYVIPPPNLHIYLPFCRAARNVDQYKYDYVPTHTRIMLWLVGLPLGSAIDAIKTRKINTQLSKVR